MSRPRTGYKLADGTKVPGVTTICKLWGESGGLLYWACRQGQANPDLATNEALYGARDKAAEAGTLTHELFDAYLRGNKLPVTDNAEALQGFENAKQWLEMSGMEPVPFEEPMVSEAVKIGGTPDVLFRHGNKVYLGDVKTGKLVEPHIYQLAAYSLLLKECRGIEVDGYHILRFPRDKARFVHYWFDNLGPAKQGFLMLRAMYDIHQEIKPLLK